MRARRWLVIYGRGTGTRTVTLAPLRYPLGRVMVTTAGADDAIVCKVTVTSMPAGSFVGSLAETSSVLGFTYVSSTMHARLTRTVTGRDVPSRAVIWAVAACVLSPARFSGANGANVIAALASQNTAVAVPLTCGGVTSRGVVSQCAAPHYLRCMSCCSPSPNTEGADSCVT